MKWPGINCLSVVFLEWSHMCKQSTPGGFSPPTQPWYKTNLCPHFTFSIRLSPVTMATESSTPSSAATLLRAATQLWGFTPPALATTLIPATWCRVSRTGCWPSKTLLTISLDFFQERFQALYEIWSVPKVLNESGNGKLLWWKNKTVAVPISN